MRRILYLSLVDWYWIKQRPHHFCELLSQKNEVTFASRTRWKKNRNVFVLHSKADIYGDSYDFNLNENLRVIRKRLIPFQGKFKSIRKINTLIYQKYLKKLDKVNNYELIIITNPMQLEYLPEEMAKNKKIIYDCMDNYSEFSNVDSREIQKNERNLVNQCDFITVSSLGLFNKLVKTNSAINNKMKIINNGVDIVNFNRENLNAEDEINIFRGRNKKKVGYIGTVSEWLDFDLIAEVALENQDIDFYIVGPIENKSLPDKLKNIDNIIFVGSQPYKSIPGIIDKLNVCIMPFVNNDLIKSVNPVKIYEYLSMGKAVIATEYEETQKFGDLIYTYNNAREFRNALKISFDKEDDKFMSRRRIDYANENSWNSRIEEFESIIESILN